MKDWAAICQRLVDHQWCCLRVCAITAGVANLTTRGTGLSSSAGIFTVTKFLTFKAPQWVWYVYVCIQVLSGIQHEDILGWLAL